MTANDGIPARDTVPLDRAMLADAVQMAALNNRLSDDQVRSMRRRRRTTAASVAMASLAGLAVVGVPGRTSWPTAPDHSLRLLATRVGQHGTATLSDGTIIYLNGATRLQMDYTATRRSARLLAGEAFFDVRHDPARPFVVDAGGSQARVLGTAFDLDLTRQQVALAVYRGAVGFASAASPRGVAVKAGYGSRMRGGTVEQPTPFDPTLPDWRQGWIDTRGMRLDELVEVLDRQSMVAIAPPPGTLAAIRITGRFRVDRPRQLLGAIGEGFGFQVVEDRHGIRFYRAR